MAASPERRRTAVLISGNGSNLQALIDAASHPDYPAQIVLVISNKEEAYGLQRAQKAGIATAVLSHTAYATREAFDAALHDCLQAHQAELVCLAGFMRLLTPGFVTAWQGKMLNIHPSLLPAFKGLNTQKQALEAGVRFTGCTVHFVVPEMDAGPIIIQAAVPVHQQDNVTTLAARIHTEEHRIYPLALSWLATGRLRVDAGKVEVQGSTDEANSLIQPTP